MSDWDAFPVVDAQDDWSAFPVIAPPQPILPKKEPSWLENIPYVGKAANAIGDAALGVGTSMLAAPISGYAGIAGALMPGPEGQGAAWQKKVAEALTYQPETGFGKGVEDVLGYPGEKLHQGAQYVGNKVEDYTGSPMAATAAQTGIESLPMFLPYGIKKAFPEAGVAGSEPTRALQQAANAQKDAAAVAAQEAGYVLPPNQVNPTLLAKTLEGFSGKADLARRLSDKNQIVSQNLIREDFGLSPDTPLTRETFNEIRSQAGDAYAAVKDTGSSAVDGQYVKDLIEFKAPFLKQAAAYPSDVAPPILKDVNALMQPVIDADAAVLKIKNLRNDASKAYRAGDKETGKQYTELAGIVEDELARHLERTQQSPELLQAYQQARQTIAKAYTAEKYTKASGEIDAVGLARELKSKPLEGGMEDVAQFGANFPRAARLPTATGGSAPGLADALIGIAGAKMGFHGGGVPGMLMGAVGGMARPLAGKFLAGPYQSMLDTPSYGPSMGNRAMSAIQEPTAGMGVSAWGIESEDEKRRKMLAQILGGY